MSMREQYRLFRRAGGVHYAEDTETKKQTSLGTKDKQEAKRLLHAKNESHRQPQLNYQLGQVYLCASTPLMATWDWNRVFNQTIQSKSGPTHRRWENARKDKALVPILHKTLIDTRPGHLIEAMRIGTVSTNVYLRRLSALAGCRLALPRTSALRLPMAMKRSDSGTWRHSNKFVISPRSHHITCFYLFPQVIPPIGLAPQFPAHAEDPQGPLPFHTPHVFANRQLGRYLHQRMHVVRLHIQLHYLTAQRSALFPDA